MNTILFMGYNGKHSDNFEYIYPEESDSYLLVFTRTPAEFFVDGDFVSCPANTAMLYAPRQTVHYRAAGVPYENDWIRFHSDEPFVTEFPLCGVPFSVSDPEYCHQLIKLLTWETSLPGNGNDQIILDLLRILFRKLLSDAYYKMQKATNADAHASELIALRKNIFNSPARYQNISQMADDLHISTGYLQLLYKRQFGVSCLEDIIASRLRLAKDQLSYTTRSIGEISEICGYNNVEHFCRQFKQQTGFTPAKYRHASVQDIPTVGASTVFTPGSEPEDSREALTHQNLGGKDVNYILTTFGNH